MDKSGRILLTVTLGTLMSAVDSTVVLLALPTISGDLHAGLLLAIWTLLVYLMVVAIFTTQLGSVGDSFGHGRVFTIGFVVFTIGSFFCGASSSIWMLVAFRGGQAFGAALMQANGNALIADTFPYEKRGKAFGYTTMGWNVGGTLGIVLGGVLTTFLGWQFIFYINVPIGIIGIWLGYGTFSGVRKKGKVPDTSGLVLIGASLLISSYGATQVVSTGTTPFNVLLILAGVLLFPLFLFLERGKDNPVMDPKVFRSRTLLIPLMASFFQAVGYLSVIFLLILYLQGVRGLSPFDASLLLVPGYILSSAFAPKMGSLSDRFGSRLLATMGIAFLIAAVFLYSLLTTTTSFYYIIAVSLISGIGGSMFWPSNNRSVMAASGAGSYGSVSGVLRTLSNIGTLTSYVLVISVAASSVPRAEVFEVFLGTGGSLIGGISASFMDGIRSALLVSLVMLIISVLLSALRSSGIAKKTLPDPEEETSS